MSQRGAGKGAAPADDSDLEDLIQNKDGGRKTSVEETPLNLDHLTKGQLDVPRRTFSGPGLGAVVSAHCRYLCFVYPKCCGCLSFSTVAIVMFFLIGALLNPTETFGVIKNDYSNIQSEYDLSLGKIDHWCLKGDNDSCRCEDPLEPSSRIEFKTWNAAHSNNKKLVEAYVDSEMLDVAFVGESLVEEMDGRWMGRAQGDDLKGIEKIFKKQFKREKSGMEGVALGIAGDTSPNVLWRLLHGEMPADFNPRVWWVVLGMNDLGRMQCSEEVVVLGILRVVEEIRTRKPDAKIVINSLLPMADLRGGLYPQIRDYRDAFRDQYKGRPGTPNRLDNPALYARGPGGAAGSAAASAAAEAAIKAAIQYQRPVTTTTALRNRHKGTHRGGPLPTGAARPVGGAGAPLRPGGAPGTPNTGGNDNDGKTPGGAGAAKRFPRDDGTRKLKKRKDDEVVEEDDNGEPKTRAEIKKDKKAEKKFIKQIKKDPVNPKLNMDKTKIKARDPKKLYMKPNRLPLWTSIHAINEQLRKFAEKHESITFFDATDIFAERLDGKRYVLQSDKISIRGHPTAKGFQEWEEAMATKLKKMFEKDDEELAKEAAAAEEQEKEQQKQPGKTIGGQDKNSDSDSSDDDDTA